MPIRIDDATRTFTLHTLHTTYQMQVDEVGYLTHLYYGARSEGQMSYLPTFADRSGCCTTPHDVKGRTYSLDVLPQEFPFQGNGDLRSPLLVVRDAQGTFGCDLRYARHEVRCGKYALAGLPAAYADADADDAQTLSVTLADERLGLEVELLYGVLPAIDVICRAAVVKNRGEGRITVEKLQSACLDFVHGSFDVITFNGQHCMERKPSRQHVLPGSFAVGSRRGQSSHQYNPFMILCDRDATETAGRAWSMTFVYSGNFKAEVEQTQYQQIRMQMGLSDELFSYPLEPSQISLISMFTIGVPAFFLALEPNKNIIKGHFLTNVFLKALPAAVTDALAVGALVVFGRTFGVDSTDISTAATMLLAIVGFMILYKISAPMNKIRVGILAGCIAGLLFCSIFLKDLFAITGMTMECVMLFVVFAIATEPVLRYLTVVVEKMRFYYLKIRGRNTEE